MDSFDVKTSTKCIDTWLKWESYMAKINVKTAATPIQILSRVESDLNHK